MKFETVISIFTYQCDVSKYCSSDTEEEAADGISHKCVWW
jgi:hypothetical protein